MKTPRLCAHCIAEHRGTRRKGKGGWCKANRSVRIGTPFPTGRGCALYGDRPKQEG